jgi:hypothetical protein
LDGFSNPSVPCPALIIDHTYFWSEIITIMSPFQIAHHDGYVRRFIFITPQPYQFDQFFFTFIIFGHLEAKCAPYVNQYKNIFKLLLFKGYHSLMFMLQHLNIPYEFGHTTSPPK